MAARANLDPYALSVLQFAGLNVVLAVSLNITNGFTYDVAGATVEDNTLWGGKCILFDNGPRWRVDDNPAIEGADRITIETWVNTLSWPTRAVV